LKSGKLKIRRIRFGMTQEDLSHDTAISQQRISLIERGVAPTRFEAIKIADSLKTNYKNLFKEIA